MFNGIELGMTWSKTETNQHVKKLHLPTNDQERIQLGCPVRTTIINTGVCISGLLAKFTLYWM